MNRCQSLFSVIAIPVILALVIEIATALVVSAPGIGIANTSVDIRQHVEDDAAIALPLVLRIRSTTKEDLPKIASLLASSRVAADESHWNWKTSMEVLRNKSSMQTLLSSRYEVMKEGERVVTCVPLDDDITDSDRIRLLWSHDGFQRKLQKAAALAKEPHMWRQCDFAVAPQNPQALRHAMITAQDVITGNVVGFCEVAMLALPSSSQDEFASIASAPTIANLVSSTRHRRQGIASSLLKSAKEYVQRQWSSDTITLYVDSTNKGAISLYSKHGFIPVEFRKGELYMTKTWQRREKARELVGL